MSLKIVTINPATGRKLREYDAAERKDVEAAVAHARAAFKAWRTLKIPDRSRILLEAAKILRSKDLELGKIMTEEMGKVIKQAVAEVRKSAWAFEFYAEHAEEFLKPERAETDANLSYVSFEPLGVVASIMPWNFPMWQLVRFAVPALTGGNTTVFKPSSVTPETGLRLASVLADAGLPAGCFTTLVGDYRLGGMLIEAPTDAVSFTGSVEAGTRVAEMAARHLKKYVLELGGSDAFIVLEGADPEIASSAAITGRFINNGQSCIAAKRFFVHKKVAKEFIERFVQKAEKLKIGDPMSDQTELGPIVREEALEEFDRQVKQSVAQGANVLTGGRRLEQDGFFYPPTILTDVKPSMPVMQEETFGPAAPVMVVNDDAEAVERANESEFGLGASIWTSNPRRGEELARQVNVGIVTVNNVVVSDPRVPFGGIKRSGIGRELSRYGLLEFMNIKTVRVYEKSPESALRL
jgi:succinate-semialdehyde dehydrogenase/glutarate-semialdehyde dehydrogenase/succinyl-CoA reductase